MYTELLSLGYLVLWLVGRSLLLLVVPTAQELIPEPCHVAAPRLTGLRLRAAAVRR